MIVEGVSKCDFAMSVSKCDFAMSRDVACRVSMFATTYKTFNINSLSNQIVETQNFASLLPQCCGMG